jgi:hypothetical protein
MSHDQSSRAHMGYPIESDMSQGVRGPISVKVLLHTLIHHCLLPYLTSLLYPPFPSHLPPPIAISLSFVMLVAYYFIL